MALRLGFITNHNLPLSYDFHNYLLRSMDEEFRGIVGISVPLWIYAIICMFVNVHGTNAYFWSSFLPAILILLTGTKLHHIVMRLALEVKDGNECTGEQLNLRDELFWFQKPRLLLWLIQIISFQNAFEMATFIWSLWEINEPSCFMSNRIFLVIRLTSGVIFQFWCSFITFPLYVIVTQMGSKFNKALIAENIRDSLHGWIKKVKEKPKQSHCHGGLTTATSSTSLQSMDNGMEELDYSSSHNISRDKKELSLSDLFKLNDLDVTREQHLIEESLHVSHCSDPFYDRYNNDNNGNDNHDEKGESDLLSSHC